MGDIWNTSLITISEKSPVYSNEDRTASVANGISFIRNLTPQTAGKWYSEILVAYANAATDNYRVGIVGASLVSENFDNVLFGQDSQSVGWSSRGNVMNYNYISTASPYMSGDIVCIASDFDNNIIWFRTNDGPWCDEENSPNSVADPTTLLGGLDIFQMSAVEKYIGVMLSNGSSATIPQLTYTPPEGFTTWLNYPPVDNAVVNVTLTSLKGQGVMFAGSYMANIAATLSLTANSNIYSFDPDGVVFTLPSDFYGAQARVNMYDVPIVIHLVLTDSYVSYPVLMNYPINRTDFHLLRGVPNTIQFFIRDVDRQIDSGPLANAVLTLNIVETYTNTVLLQRNLNTVNSTTALYSVTTQPSDVLNWPTGPLQYSVMVTRQDGTQSMLWTDRNYTPFGYCIMMDGPLPPPPVPTTLDPTTFLVKDGYAFSSALPGTASFGYPNSLQTFSFYTANSYTGNVIIQGSLISQPSTNLQDWFPVIYQNFNASNGVTAVNIEGNFLWLRVVLPTLEPVPYPGLPVLPMPSGNVVQIIYQN